MRYFWLNFGKKREKFLVCFDFEEIKYKQFSFLRPKLVQTPRSSVHPSNLSQGTRPLE